MQKLTKMIIWILQKWWYSLVDNQKRWLHAKFQPPKSKEGRFSHFLKWNKNSVSALKNLLWALQPRGLPQTKTFATPGHPMDPSCKPTHQPDFDFLKSKSSQNSALKCISPIWADRFQWYLGSEISLIGLTFGRNLVRKLKFWGEHFARLSRLVRVKYF